MNNASTTFLLNIGHAIDHMFLLIFATAVTTIALEFGIERWEDLMPYTTAAFFFFGIGALPAGRLGDLWNRRAMMIVFFFGMGASALLVSLVQSPLQLAIALAVLGCFAAIYHPVGIPMLLQGAKRPGWMIGVNGFTGNLGIALGAVLTGFLVQQFGWRVAFAAPGAFSIVCGVAFWATAGKESIPAARRTATQVELPTALMARVFLVMTLAATSASLLFNFSTNGNYELLHERFTEVSRDPARLGLLLGVVYVIASFAQLVVGKLLDRLELKSFYLSVLTLQIPFLALAAHADGWVFYALQVVFMIAIFSAIPFSDAMIVRYVDDRMRSRVSGVRFAVAFGASSLAVWALGPIVKQAGFTVLLWIMAGLAACTFAVAAALPSTRTKARAPEGDEVPQEA